MEKKISKMVVIYHLEIFFLSIFWNIPLLHISIFLQFLLKSV